MGKNALCSLLCVYSGYLFKFFYVFIVDGFPQKKAPTNYKHNIHTDDKNRGVCIKYDR